MPSLFPSPTRFERIVEPEILDALAPDDRAAHETRRDLRLINAAMGNHRWFQRTLPGVVRPTERVLEIGAGTGELMTLLARERSVDGLDLWPRPTGVPFSSTWHQMDVMAFEQWAAYPGVIGNMIFHQFDAAALRRIGGNITAHARVFLACEPARRRRFQWLLAAYCPLIRASHVSRHDGRVSIRAGFLGTELPELLGMDAANWEWRITTSAFGAYRVVATKRP